MSVDPIPENLHSVTPSITVSPCAEAIDFYVAAFGAVEISGRMTGPDGLVAHAEIRIGNSVMMLNDENEGYPTSTPKTLGGSTMALFIWVDDVDTAFAKATDLGCEIIYPLETQFYGVRGGRLKDPFGHTWGLGQQVEIVSDEELAKRAQTFFEEQS